MLTPEQLEAATAEAYVEIGRNPTGDLRAYLQGWMLTTFADSQRSEWWGEATEVVLQQDVRDAMLEAVENDKVLQAFAKDKSDFYETRDTGAFIDNPWITMGLQSRKDALAERMKVIALSNQGDGNETAPEEPIDYVVAEQLAREGEALSDKSLEQRLDEVAYSSDAMQRVRLAFDYMARKESAISAGTYKSPETIQREIAVAAFNAREAAGG